jgi:hypothetical protein
MTPEEVLEVLDLHYPIPLNISSAYVCRCHVCRGRYKKSLAMQWNNWRDHFKKELEAKSDLIHIGDMHSYRAWERFAEQREWIEWFHRWIEPQWLAWFIEILKQSDDDPELFPHGKWASIQVLQGKIAAAAAGERHTIPQKLRTT